MTQDHPLLIGQLLLSPLATSPHREIVYRDLSRYDYRTLRERIGRLAGLLSGLGIEHGDVVAVMDWDSHRYLEAYFAIPMMGATLLTVNVRLSPEQILYTVNHAEARVLLVHADFLPLLDKLREHLPHIEKVVLLSDMPAPPPPGFDAEYEAGLAAAPDFAFESFDENTRATLFYTTGTTGLPKGVSFTHRQLVLHTLTAAVGLGRSAGQGRAHRESVYMPMTPMFHVHAWGVPYLATMLGMKQVYPGRYVPDRLARLIAEEKVSFSHGVPTVLQMLLACPEAAKIDLSGLTMVVGGSALPRGLATAALARGIDVFCGYGLSETCPILTLAQLDNDLDIDAEGEIDLRVSGGQPLPLVDLRIVDEEMRVLPADGVAQGEIVARAPWLTAGYHKDEEASRRLWAGGYMHTNDLGTQDSHGYVRITDRLKDVIKTGGEWVSSLDLESLISRHPAVAEAAVIAIKCEQWGERPLALVVSKPGQAVDPAAVQAHLRDFVARGEISKYAVPERVLQVDAIEKTSVGKIDKKLLRRKYAS